MRAREGWKGEGEVRGGKAKTTTITGGSLSSHARLFVPYLRAQSSETAPRKRPWPAWRKGACRRLRRCRGRRRFLRFRRRRGVPRSRPKFFVDSSFFLFSGEKVEGL